MDWLVRTCSIAWGLSLLISSPSFGETCLDEARYACYRRHFERGVPDRREPSHVERVTVHGTTFHVLTATRILNLAQSSDPRRHYTEITCSNRHLPEQSQAQAETLEDAVAQAIMNCIHAQAKGDIP